MGLLDDSSSLTLCYASVSTHSHVLICTAVQNPGQHIAVLFCVCESANELVVKEKHRVLTVNSDVSVSIVVANLKLWKYVLCHKIRPV